MTLINRRASVWPCALFWCLLISPVSPRAALQQARDATPAPKPIEAVFSNIQVLKGLPSSELPPIMHFMRASLGVRCEFCHVAEEGKYALDDKPQKKRAREMILMTRRLNEETFGGKTVVTCDTCHQGRTKPAAVPQIGTPFLNIVRRVAGEPEPAALPTLAELISKYESTTHITTVPGMQVTLEGCHAKPIDLGTPNARALARAACNTAEVLFDARRAVTTSPLPNGQSIRVGSNGERGWTVGPEGLRWIPTSDFIQFQRKINPVSVARLALSDFASSVISGVEQVDGQPAYVVMATGTDGTAQGLWFSVADGLLLRRTFYHPFAMGLDPEQFDFSEYKQFGAVRIPTTINTSYLDDQHLGILKRLLEAHVSVSTSNQDFEPPPRWPPG